MTAGKVIHVYGRKGTMTAGKVIHHYAESLARGKF